MFEFSELNIPIIIGAAVVDSINPCAFGVLIFLLSYLFRTFKSHRHVMIHGLMYTLGVFLTYLIAGALLLPIIQSLGRLSVGLYVVISAVIIIAGLLEIKDFFWYGRGPSLAIFPSAAERIKLYTKRVSEKMTTSFMLGVFVALVELPCTGAVYLAVLALMSISGVTVGNLSLLVIYNILFVLPLLVIISLVHRAATVQRIEDWRKRHRKEMRLVTGLILLTLAGWMIWYIV